jgi:hypothetical protein
MSQGQGYIRISTVQALPNNCLAQVHQGWGFQDPSWQLRTRLNIRQSLRSSPPCALGLMRHVLYKEKHKMVRLKKGGAKPVQPICMLARLHVLPTSRRRLPVVNPYNLEDVRPRQSDMRGMQVILSEYWVTWGLDGMHQIVRSTLSHPGYPESAVCGTACY